MLGNVPVRRLVLFVALIAAATSVHAGVVRQLIRLALAEPSASHLPVVPLIVAALIVYRRDEIFRTVRSSRAGAVLIGVGVILMQGMSLFQPPPEAARTGSVLSLLLMWMGAFLFTFGTIAFRAAAFAMVFLLLTVPIPSAVLEGITDVLKAGSAASVAALFTLSGTPYHREGFVFVLPTLSIEIADECSGIRSTLALGVTALLAGHVTLRNWWSTAALVLAVVPVAVFKNGIRIVTLSLLTIHVDPSIIVGRLHTDGGVVFFLLALAMMSPILGGLGALERWRDTRVARGAALGRERSGGLA